MQTGRKRLYSLFLPVCLTFRRVSFNRCDFDGNISFDEAEFDEKIHFEHFFFKKKASFINTKFNKTIEFRNGIFDSIADFTDSKPYGLPRCFPSFFNRFKHSVVR